MRGAFLVALVVATTGVVGLSAPAPARPASELRLSLSTKSLEPRLDDGDGFDVTLALRNASRARAELPALTSFSGRLEGCSGVTYVVRFPDGSVLSWRWPMDVPLDLAINPGTRPTPPRYPLVLTGRGSATAVVELCRQHTREFVRLFRAHDGKFSLTATVPALGLKSNTLRYHGCPEPPESFDPLAHQGR